MRLFHFSDDPEIEVFIPRPVLVPAKRKPGFEWLNGPLVWAIDEWHQPMYLFPRDCPRILMWPTEKTSSEDQAQYFPDQAYRMIAFVEESWEQKMEDAHLYRYELPVTGFESLQDAGMWVSRKTVAPISVNRVVSLPTKLAEKRVDLRVMPSLVPLRNLWQNSFHVSGIRLRNAKGWDTR